MCSNKTNCCTNHSAVVVLPLSGVDDWGLGQLCALTSLTGLNLAATDVQLRDAAALQQLSKLAKLQWLSLSRCGMAGQGRA
jgi:hypothetical protein